MKGPINLVRSNEIAGYINITSIYEWTEDKTYLVIDQISYKQKQGLYFVIITLLFTR